MEYFFVYILRCSDDSYYVGHTDNLEKRISEHRIGKISGYTKTRLPIDVAYTQYFTSRYEALAAERKIKGWSRKKKEALICKDWKALVELSNK